MLDLGFYRVGWLQVRIPLRNEERNPPQASVCLWARKIRSNTATIRTAQSRPPHWLTSGVITAIRPEDQVSGIAGTLILAGPAVRPSVFWAALWYRTGRWALPGVTGECNAWARGRTGPAIAWPLHGQPWGGRVPSLPTSALTAPHFPLHGPFSGPKARDAGAVSFL